MSEVIAVFKAFGQYIKAASLLWKQWDLECALLKNAVKMADALNHVSDEPDTYRYFCNFDKSAVVREKSIAAIKHARALNRSLRSEP